MQRNCKMPKALSFSDSSYTISSHVLDSKVSWRQVSDLTLFFHYSWALDHALASAFIGDSPLLRVL